MQWNRKSGKCTKKMCCTNALQLELVNLLAYTIVAQFPLYVKKPQSECTSRNAKCRLSKQSGGLVCVGVVELEITQHNLRCQGRDGGGSEEIIRGRGWSKRKIRKQGTELKEKWRPFENLLRWIFPFSCNGIFNAVLSTINHTHNNRQPGPTSR